MILPILRVMMHQLLTCFWNQRWDKRKPSRSAATDDRGWESLGKNWRSHSTPRLRSCLKNLTRKTCKLSNRSCNIHTSKMTITKIIPDALWRRDSLVTGTNQEQRRCLHLLNVLNETKSTSNQARPFVCGGATLDLLFMRGSPELIALWKLSWFPLCLCLSI